MPKEMKTRRNNVRIEIEYGEYSVGFCYQVTIGNRLLETYIKYPVKPTSKQLRQLKKAWFNEMCNPDIKAVYYKKYDIRKGKYISLK